MAQECFKARLKKRKWNFSDSGKIERVCDRINQNKGWFSSTLDGLKDYFDVTNEYVLRKILIILFPFTVKEEGWKRQVSYDMTAGGDPNAKATPRNDVQAPDLYIPFMSLVTFLIVSGCVQGFSRGKFEMEKLFILQSFIIFFWLFETLVLKGCFYFMNIANLAYMELLCYTGYKFVALCFVACADGLGGKLGSYVALGCVGGLFAWFFFATMRRSITSNTLADHIKQVSMNKQSALAFASAAQLFFLWLLSCQY